MSAPDPVFPVGSRIRFEDDVAVGDCVYFDIDTEPGIVLVRRLPEWEARSHDGTVYRLEAGDGPTNIKIRRVRFDAKNTGGV
jgi:hypothetical protein